MVRPGKSSLANPFQPIRNTVGYDSEEEEPRRIIKKEPSRAPRGLESLTLFDKGASTKPPKMELPNPYKGNTRGCKATQWLDQIMLWVALHRNQLDEEEQMVVWILYHVEDKAANWSLPLINNIIKGFQNLIAELDWDKEAYIAQFTQGLHRKVKELLSTKDSVPDKLKAIFAAAIKIDNICCKDEENCPGEAAAKSLVTATTSTTTTTHRVCLSEDPKYVNLKEKDCHCAAGLCVKCGQKGHGIKQCPNGWKATMKEGAKVAEVAKLENK
ncbi:hypothetical protein RhiTH_009782 [Rhizoctonia solani]